MTKDMNDKVLDQLFASAKDATPKMTPDFIARLEADMLTSVPEPESRPVHVSSKPNWLAGLFTASGLSGAALAGLWIGFAMPEVLDPFTLTTDDSVALSAFLPSADLGVVFDE